MSITRCPHSGNDPSVCPICSPGCYHVCSLPSCKCDQLKEVESRAERAEARVAELEAALGAERAKVVRLRAHVRHKTDCRYMRPDSLGAECDCGFSAVIADTAPTPSPRCPNFVGTTVQCERPEGHEGQCVGHVGTYMHTATFKETK